MRPLSGSNAALPLPTTQLRQRPLAFQLPIDACLALDAQREPRRYAAVVVSRGEELG